MKNNFKLLAILILMSCTDLNAQIRHTKHFIKLGKTHPLCSEMIILDSLGYYFEESGCEGDGHVSFGKYKLTKNNIISFYPLPLDSLQGLRTIKRIKSSFPSDTILTITIFDRYNHPLAYNLNIDAIALNGEVSSIYTDEKGQILLNRKYHKDVILLTLDKLYGKTETIVYKDDITIEVYLGLPEIFLWLKEITFIESNPFQLALRGDNLYSVRGNIKLYSVSEN